jgi:hypothetical protein
MNDMTIRGVAAIATTTDPKITKAVGQAILDALVKAGYVK